MLPRTISAIILFYCLTVLVACNKNTSKQVVSGDNSYSWVRPANFPEPVYTFGDNTFSKAGFELGKKLFHDPLLSVNNTISCASCHKQSNAFSDPGVAFSAGIYGRTAARHSPALFNLAWNKSFMWDGGVNHIEVMPLAPLTNQKEMGETIANIVTKLQSDDTYPAMFREAFGFDTVDSRQMFWALAQYMSNLISANSKYDRYILGTEQLDNNELKGLELFRANCASCHKEPLFTDYSFQNNGIDSIFIADGGHFRITRDPSDTGKFKVPSLRNIEVTYPYMHDGRFNTLQQVLNHYSDDVKQSATLSPLLIKDGHTGFRFTEEEKNQIILFLETLTDKEFLENKDY